MVPSGRELGAQLDQAAGGHGGQAGDGRLGETEEHAWIPSKGGVASQPQPPAPGRSTHAGWPGSDLLRKLGNPSNFLTFKMWYLIEKNF